MYIYTVNPLINAPFFLTPPSNKRPPPPLRGRLLETYQKYSNKCPLQPASVLPGNNRHDTSLRLKNLLFF